MLNHIILKQTAHNPHFIIHLKLNSNFNIKLSRFYLKLHNLKFQNISGL